jgi:hypothetical protein
MLLQKLALDEFIGAGVSLQFKILVSRMRFFMAPIQVDTAS